MSDLSERKIKLMKAIADLNSDAAVEAFENLLARMQERNPGPDALYEAHAQKTDLEQLKKEQNYFEFDKVEFQRILEAMDIQDTNGELLKALSA